MLLEALHFSLSEVVSGSLWVGSWGGRDPSAVPLSVLLGALHLSFPAQVYCETYDVSGVRRDRAGHPTVSAFLEFWRLHGAL